MTKGVRILRPGGGTSLYDALYFACRDKLLKSQEGRPARRAIILLSDGEDNQSHVSREEAIEMAQRAEVIVYAIARMSVARRAAGTRYWSEWQRLRAVAFSFPFRFPMCPNFFTEIENELRSQYALAYKPADFRDDGRYRAVSIVAQNKKDLRVRARPGYYAPQQ